MCPVPAQTEELFRKLYDLARTVPIPEPPQLLVAQPEDGEAFYVLGSTYRQASELLLQEMAKRNVRVLSGLIAVYPPFDRRLPPIEKLPESHFMESRLDIPAFDLRQALLQLDERNAKTQLFLIGEECIRVRTIESSQP